jgi:hypothetical protein
VRALRDNGLTLAFLGLMLVTVSLQAFSGWRLELDELRAHHAQAVPFWSYVASSSFGVDVLENWQSEFLQFAAFIAATVWLVQRGSSEAKAPEDAGREPSTAPWLRRHSLLLVMLLCFAATWLGQAVTGWRAYNEEQGLHGDAALSWGGYLTEPEFWARTLQNWQSEFLAVAAMSIFTVHLREHGSPESKRVSTPDEENEPTY